MRDDRYQRMADEANLAEAKRMSGETQYPTGHERDRAIKEAEHYTSTDRIVPRYEKEDDRKCYPLARGLLDYFPQALLAVAEVSRVGNEQHNLGEPMRWVRGKSMDQADALMRHLVDRGKLDDDGLRHSAKVAWRALALLQLELENSAIAVEALDERNGRPGRRADHEALRPLYAYGDARNS